MSGRKCSRFQLDAERERKSQMFSVLSSGERQLVGLCQRILDAMSRLSHASRRRFSSDLTRVEDWMHQVAAASDRRSRLSLSSPESDLNSAANDVSRLTTIGQAAFETVNKIAQELDGVRLRLDMTLSRLESQLKTSEAFLTRWHSNAAFTDVRKSLSAARGHWSRDEFDIVSRELTRLESELINLIAQAESREVDATKQRHLRDLTHVEREIAAIRAQLGMLVDSASSGLRETFSDQFAGAQSWLSQTNVTLSALPSDLGPADVALVLASERERKAIGQRQLEELGSTLGEQAAQLRSHAEAIVSEAEAEWNGGKQVLGLWLGEAEFSGLKKSVGSIRQLLTEDMLRKIEEPGRTLLKELRTQAESAARQEELHQKRMYFLRALRQVCSEMGFQECAPPSFKEPNRRSSQIQLVVDTLDRGVVTFYVGLESIESDSCLSNDVCPTQFQKLADEIRDRFGVGFHLQPVGGANPVRISRNELDEPDGGHTSMAK